MKLKVTKWKQKPNTEYSTDGLIRKNTNKPEYGSLMLNASVIAISKGFMNKKTRIGFVTAKFEELEDIVHDHKLEEGSDFSDLVSPHRIVIIEKVASKMTDEDFGYTEKVNPSTGEVLKCNGETIFRKTEVVEEGSDVKDTYVSHNAIAAPIDSANVEFSGKSNVLKEL